jgi:hypothetical protein
LWIFDGSDMGASVQDQYKPRSSGRWPGRTQAVVACPTGGHRRPGPRTGATATVDVGPTGHLRFEGHRRGLFDQGDGYRCRSAV